MDNDKKNTHGGSRIGAGRPKGDSKLFTFRCSGDLARSLDEKPNRTKFIRDSIEKSLKAESRVPTSIGPVTRASSVSPMHLPYFDVRVRAGFPVPLDNDERSQDIEILSMLCPHPESSYLIRVIGDSMADPKAYEEAQGWFGDFEEKFSGMDEKAIVAWMKDGYGHRDGLEKFTEFCANRNNSTVSNIFYD